MTTNRNEWTHEEALMKILIDFYTLTRGETKDYRKTMKAITELFDKSLPEKNNEGDTPGEFCYSKGWNTCLEEIRKSWQEGKEVKK
jgi:hypothetical protein